MSSAFPLVTGRFVAHKGETQSRRLSLVVSVIDEFTGSPPDALLRVQLTLRADKNILRTLNALRNNSGMFYFEDVPDPEPDTGYVLLVEPDPLTANWFYLKPIGDTAGSYGFERPVKLPRPDPLKPSLAVTLSPNSAYPFPATATLARGIVTEGENKAAAANAIVRCEYDQFNEDDTNPVISALAETQTSPKGEYVLFFKKLPKKTQKVTITAARDEKNGESKETEITEGTTTPFGPIHIE